MVAQLLRQCCCQCAFAAGAGPVDTDDWGAGGVGLHEAKEGAEVFREGFGGAGWVGNAHGLRSGVEGGERKAHGHAVVVIGVDASGLPALWRGWRGDGDVVCTFLHRSAQLA